MSKLTEIHIEGFCSLRDIELTKLGPVTVLIGPNGSGKSNLLSALRMVTMMATKSTGLFVGQAGGASALLHYGPQQTPVMNLRLEFETDTGTQNAYRVRLGYAAGEAFIFLDEEAGFRELKGDWRWISAGAGHGESRIDEVYGSATIPRTVQWLLRHLSFFHFHDTSYTSALRTNARFEDDRFLRSNGSNLPAYLLSLRDSQTAANQEAFRRIQELIRQIAPFLRELSPKAVAGGAVRLDWIDDRGEVFGAHQLSDGTLRAIALFTALAVVRDAAELPSLRRLDLGLGTTCGERSIIWHAAAPYQLPRLAELLSRPEFAALRQVLDAPGVDAEGLQATIDQRVEQLRQQIES